METGQVRQSFSHGRSKARHRARSGRGKKRMIGPEPRPRGRTQRAAAIGRARAAVGAAPASRPSRRAGRWSVAPGADRRGSGPAACARCRMRTRPTRRRAAAPRRPRRIAGAQEEERAVEEVGAAAPKRKRAPGSKTRSASPRRRRWRCKRSDNEAQRPQGRGICGARSPSARAEGGTAAKVAALAAAGKVTMPAGEEEPAGPPRAPGARPVIRKPAAPPRHEECAGEPGRSPSYPRAFPATKASACAASPRCAGRESASASGCTRASRSRSRWCARWSFPRPSRFRNCRTGWPSAGST